jgi:hypothetical protein
MLLAHTLFQDERQSVLQALIDANEGFILAEKKDGYLLCRFWRQNSV